MPKTVTTGDLSGLRFGRLEVMWPSTRVQYRRGYVCKCDCGTKLDVQQYQLLNGLMQSCGCQKREYFKGLDEKT